MCGECYFCHGTISRFETGHILLTGHADHEVYLHEQCATGNNLVEAAVGDEGVAVTCPECGRVETRD